jgi:hypothetical protein
MVFTKPAFQQMFTRSRKKEANYNCSGGRVNHFEVDVDGLESPLRNRTSDFEDRFLLLVLQHQVRRKYSTQKSVKNRIKSFSNLNEDQI